MNGAIKVDIVAVIGYVISKDSVKIIVNWFEVHDTTKSKSRCISQQHSRHAKKVCKVFICRNIKINFMCLGLL